MGIILKDHAVGFGIIYGTVVLIFIACSAITTDPASQQLISALPVAAYVYWSLTQLILGPSPKSRAGRRAGVLAPDGLSRSQLQSDPLFEDDASVSQAQSPFAGVTFRLVEPRACTPDASAKEPAPSPPPTDAEKFYREEQLILSAADKLVAVPIMNYGESQIFYGAVNAVEFFRPRTNGWHVHAQPSLGEIISPQCPRCRFEKDGSGRRSYLAWRCDSCFRAFKVINAKRPDLAICDQGGRPVLVIEHQGTFHIDRSTPQRQRESELRNQVKEHAYDLAGIPWLPTDPDTSREQAFELIVERLKPIVDDLTVRKRKRVLRRRTGL